MSNPADQADTVLLRVENSTAWITLNRPDCLNAFAGSMRDRLADAVTSASADPGVRVIVISGAGRAFSAGADLGTMATMIDSGDAAGFGDLVRAGTRVVRAIRAARQPVVAAVNGVAVGAGASLAIACDMRVASSSASIGFTFNRIGLHPDWGATFFLPRLVGPGRARELVFTGRIVEAEEAARIGLFERVVRADDFDGEIRSLTSAMAEKSPLSLALAKRSLSADEDAALESAMRREVDAQTACFATPEVVAGVRAFGQKRDTSIRSNARESVVR
ncbi:MAG TPA: enoyl-CoA hydratase-related protein [Longimicrobiaceae bacterium]|nr:enoyl-CoA hydratase-related protein [Longimicrobiaceae bacterium]